jgi:phosphohistidine phosphatase
MIRIRHKGDFIKTIYLIRHAKSDWNNGKLSDFQRGLTKQGMHDLETMGSYLALRKVKPDLILSSAALRAQLTADGLAEKMNYKDSIQYMDELYLTKPEMIINVLSLQDDQYESIMLVGHNPALSELANILQDENFTKLPTLGVLAITLEVDSWEEIKEQCHGVIDFFIFPKQFKYYMPGQIRSTLE